MSKLIAMRKFRTVALQAVAVLAMTALGSQAQDGPSEAMKALVDAATKEGRIVWYEASPQEMAEKVINDFKASYPGIEVEYLQIGGSQRMARVSQESMSGGPTADVSFDAAGAIMTLAEQGFLEETDWEALGFDTASGEAPNQYMLRLDSIPFVTVYNTNMVAEEDVPASYDDLLKDDFAGNWGTWARPNGFVNLLPAWGEEKTLEFVRNLAGTKPRLYREPTTATAAVGAGEVAMAHFISFNSLRSYLEKGAPIKFAFLSPVPVVSIYGYVPKFAEHPNAGKLFLAWLASPEGAASFEEATGRGSPFKKSTALGRLTEGMEISAWNVEEQIAQIGKINDLEKEFAEILQDK